MGKPILLVSSVTYAIKGRDMLNRNGFRAYLQRVPKTGANGCGYGLYVPQRTEEAIQLLAQSGVRVLGRAERGEGR